MPPRRTPPPEPTYTAVRPDTFQDLVRQIKTVNGWTNAELENRSGINFKRWEQWGQGNPPLRGFPDVANFPRIAVTLRVPVREITRTLGLQLGLDLSGDDWPGLPTEAYVLPDGWETLTVADWEAITVFTRRMIGQARQIAALTDLVAPGPGEARPAVRRRTR